MALGKVLVIGVGGSGVKTLMALRAVLLRRLRAVGWESDELPHAWQLLAIDTESRQPTDFAAPGLPASSFHTLVPDLGGRDTEYWSVVRPTYERVAAADRPAAYAGWLERYLERRPGDGAGQMRAVGRAVATGSLSDLSRRVQQVVGRLREGAAETDLAQVAGLMGERPDATVFPLVISSLAGGTGSGMFIDVIEALRSVDPELSQRAQVVLYGPDVFGTLTGPDRRHIPANALAAVSEITAGVWGSGLSEGTASLYRAGEIGTRPADPSGGGNAFGAKYHYLIGGTNLKGDAVAVGDDAYWSVANAIGSIVSDPKVLGPFRSYFITNVFNRSSDATLVGDASLLSVPNRQKYIQPFAALGSGRLAVGSERILEYAVQALTRSTVERLLWPNFAPSDADTDVHERAERAWGQFLRTSGLDEWNTDGERRDDVINALYRPDQTAAIAKAVDELLAVAGSGAETEGLPAQVWIERILGDLPNRLDVVAETLGTAVERSAQEYCRGAEERLLSVVANAVARDGYAVAVDLLDHLRQELTRTGGNQLEQEARDAEDRRDVLPSDIREHFEERLGTQAVADLNHDVVTGARTILRNGIDQYVGHPARCRAAASILLEVRDRMLPAVQDALRQAQALLLSDIAGGRATDRLGVPWSDFPRLGMAATIGARISPTERLLIDPGGFADEVDAAARRTVGEDLADQWATHLIDRTIRRAPLDGRPSSHPTGPLGVEQAWMPRTKELRWSPDAEPVTPRYRAVQSVREVVDEAERRLRDRDTPLGRLVARSIVEYLDEGSEVVQRERWSRFVETFIEVLNASAPLARLNERFVGAMHPKAAESLRDPRRILSTVPVGNQGTDRFKRLSEQLTTAGLWSDEIADACGESSSATHIDVFQSLGVSVSAAAFATVTEAAWREWGGASGAPDAAQSFWGHKRARPLLETLPIADRRLRELIRGWFTALPLGLVRDDSEPSNGRRVEVHDPEVRGFVSGPHPLLDRDAEGASVLPALLASLPIALAEAGSSGSIAPLRAYTRLIQLGVAAEGDASPLRRWILTGEVEEGTVPVAAADEPEPSARRAAVLALLEGEQGLLDEAVAGYERLRESDEKFWEPPLAWQLKRELQEGLTDVRSAVEAVKVGG